MPGAPTKSTTYGLSRLGNPVFRKQGGSTRSELDTQCCRYRRVAANRDQSGDERKTPARQSLAVGVTSITSPLPFAPDGRARSGGAGASRRFAAQAAQG